MHMNPLDKPDKKLAMEQWEKLAALYASFGIALVYIEPVQGLPDMTFAANCGLTFITKNGEPAIILSNFRPERRRREKEHYRDYFKKVLKYRVFELPDEIFFEGAGDAIPFGEIILVGYGFRTSAGALPLISQITGKTVVPLALLLKPGPDKKTLYHLDTTMIACNKNDRLLITYPGAFTEPSFSVLREQVTKQVGQLFPASYEDAANLALNGVVIPRQAMTPMASERLEEGMRGAIVTADTASKELLATIRACEYEPHVTPLSEFIKSGGGAFCLIKILCD